MACRDYIVENLRWKIAALVLAVFAWCAIELSIWKDQALGQARVVANQAVAVLSASGDARTFRIDPPEVSVVLRSTAAGVRNLEHQRIFAFVNLAEAPEATELSRIVLVHAPEGVEVLRIEPRTVYVEQINPRKEAATNSQNKP